MKNEEVGVFSFPISLPPLINMYTYGILNGRMEK